VRALNDRPLRATGSHVIYWMTAHRRVERNFALQRAVEAARHLRKPLVVLEALRCDYPWASDRLHRFVIDGMADQARALNAAALTYLPYVEPERGAGRGLLAALARLACLVVTDDFPCFFLPRMTQAAAGRLDVRLEAVDSNGLLPVRSTERIFATAHSFRAHLQKVLPAHLGDWPARLDLSNLPPPRRLPAALASRWPATPREVLDAPDRLLASLPIDHSVPPTGLRGGARAARAALDRFVASRLARYVDDRSHPDLDGTSGLSPYLHFGHVSAHEVFETVVRSEGWTRRKLGKPAGGKREGWWGLGRNVEAFLDQLIAWRELGFNGCALRPDDYGSYASLPVWARSTLDAHRRDRRKPQYAFEALDRARTHDDIWNAAQRQLVRDGWMHNYLRMLWGKKILEWTPSPEEALGTMVAIMDRYAIDGRDPNSYAGYLWTLGRYDRPWGPARSVFGTVRYMSSESARRKIRLRRYLQTYGEPPSITD
jgi:deoxyribodipyrimidine photo-lyase